MEDLKGLQVGQLGRYALEGIAADLHGNHSQKKRVHTQETHHQDAQRSQEAYLAWQTNEAITGELEDVTGETERCERGVSSHIKHRQRRQLTNGSGQRRQEVREELQRGQQ
jgi:hypothetical protein